MTTKTYRAGIIFVGLLSPISIASADDIIQTPEVVVTATRIAQTVEDTLAPVTIITREDIERQQVRDIRDIFRNVPGMGLVNSGGLGKATSVSLRGTESTHVLVLIDGVRVGSATKGTTSFSDIPVEQIERIEIVRGPKSSLYGSGAIGGVIQIFTRKGSGDRVEKHGSIGYGTHQTIEGTAGFSGAANDTKFALNLSKKQSNGFNSKVTNGDDKDGYSQNSIFGNISHDFANGLNIETHVSNVDSASEYDGTNSNRVDSVQRIISVKADKDIVDAWNTTLNVSRNWDLTTNFLDTAFYSKFDTVRDNATLQNNIYLNDENTVIVGLDYQFDTIESSSTYSETERFNMAAFSQYMIELGDNSVQASFRFDENEQFGESKTGSLGWGYPILEDLDVTASYATAFKAPTFNQLYSSAGNAMLDPESSKSYEIGLRGNYSNSNWAVYAYQSDVKDLISYNSGTSAFENIDLAKIRGVEAEGSMRFGKYDIASNITYVRPENRSDGSNYGNTLRRRAKWRGNLMTAYQLNDETRLGADFHFVGHSYDNTSNTTKMKRYNTVDLRGSYQFSPNWSVELSANNVFDRTYETVNNYFQDGRNMFLRFRFSQD